MKPSTVRFMLDLEHCVKNALRSIWQNVFKVDAKSWFKKFVAIIRQNCINKNFTHRLWISNVRFRWYCRQCDIF